jgi:outer membrane lipopolysaccharide assembly protein LptE/RlpB
MRKFWIGWLAVMVVAGCGYRFSGGGALPRDVKQVFVAMLENRTEETGIESILSNDLIYEFSRSGTFAKGKDQADAQLTGVIDAVTKGTISRISVNTSQERRVSLIISFRLTGKDGELIWSARRMSENEVYFVEKDKETTEHNRRLAIQRLSKRLAEKVYQRLTDNF